MCPPSCIKGLLWSCKGTPKYYLECLLRVGHPWKKLRYKWSCNIQPVKQKIKKSLYFTIFRCLFTMIQNHPNLHLSSGHQNTKGFKYKSLCFLQIYKHHRLQGKCAEDKFNISISLQNSIFYTLVLDARFYSERNQAIPCIMHHIDSEASFPIWTPCFVRKDYKY